MKYLLLILLLLPVTAETERGVSFPGLEAFDRSTCTKALRVFEGVKRPWVAFLWGSFGKTHRCIERFLALPQTDKRVQIYADNGTCSHSGRICTKYDRPDFRKRIREIGAWIRQNLARARFWVVMRLEDDERAETVKKKVKIMRRYLPRGVKIGRNPDEKTRYYIGFDFVELHGLYRTDFEGNRIRSVSNDGTDVDLGSTRKRCQSSISLSKLLDSIRYAEQRGINYLIWWQAQGGCVDEWIVPYRRRPIIRSFDIHTVNKILRNK